MPLRRERGLDRRRTPRPAYCEPDEPVERRRGRARPPRRPRYGWPLEPPQSLLQAAHRLDQDERRDAEDRAEDDRQGDDLGPAEGRQRVRQRGDRRPHAADEVRDDAGDEARKEDRVFDPAQIEDLDPEEGAGDRRSEDGGEASADPADDQPPPVLVVQAAGGPRRGSRSTRRSGRTAPPSRPIPPKARVRTVARSLTGATLQSILPELLWTAAMTASVPCPLRRRRERADEPDAEGQREPEAGRRAEAAPSGICRTSVAGRRERPEERAGPGADADARGRAEEAPTSAC